MTYRQYTRCTSPDRLPGQVVIQGIIFAASAAIGAIGAYLVAGAIVPAILIAVLTPIIIYCRWWLYDRLVCLGGDICALGMLLKVEPPESKSLLDRFDTDYSINLVLAPHKEGDIKKDIEDDGIQGNFIKDQFDGRFDFTGLAVKQWSNSPETPVLHCEFEGGGVYDLYQACLVALGLAAAAAILNAFCAVPVIGWVICAIGYILTAAAIVSVLVGIFTGLNDTANPSDVNENLGTLNTNDPTGRGADILVVRGTWVYDSAHEGWNEIHPIKFCQKTGMRWGGNWNEIGDFKGWIHHWCQAIDDATSPSTLASQASPENQWLVHPAIDGCQPDDSNEPPIIH